jgi:two-component system NarL family response regulator
MATELSDQQRIRVLLADDHLLVRVGLTSLIRSDPDLKVVAEASNGREAVEMFSLHQPDVTLLDLRMPMMNGIEATAAIHDQCPDAALIILTTYDGDENIYRAIQAGARGYLLKDVLRDELIGTIRAVHTGNYAVPSNVAAQLAQRLRGVDLTPREIEVLKGIARGLSNKELATALTVSESTIKYHINLICSKLNASGRTQAVTTALRRGIIVLE